MAKAVYFGVGGKARKTKKIYFGVGGKARKVKKAYIGVGGKARLCYAESVAKTLTLTCTEAYEGGFSNQLSIAELASAYRITTAGYYYVIDIEYHTPIIIDISKADVSFEPGTGKVKFTVYDRGYNNASRNMVFDTETGEFYCTNTNTNGDYLKVNIGDVTLYYYG